MHAAGPVLRLLPWYYERIYVHVRPERVYVWPGGDSGAEPQLLDSHLEEVRSGHGEEPEEPPARRRRRDRLGRPPATSWARATTPPCCRVVAPDGFPFAVRVPIRP